MTVRESEWLDECWPRGPWLSADGILRVWLVALRTCLPWREMYLDDVAGEFHAVLTVLLEPGDEQSPDECAARLRHVACAHGAFRRRQGCAAVVLAEEVISAEEAIAVGLMRSGASRAAMLTLQAALAPAMRVIERSTYAGYADSNEGDADS